MFTTKTGIQIPEKTDKIADINEALVTLLDIVSKLALEVDKLSDEIEKLKDTENKKENNGIINDLEDKLAEQMQMNILLVNELKKRTNE